MQEETRVEDMRLQAFIVSQNFCSNRLNAPSTADFPMDTSYSKIQYLGDSVFVINSYVDSQNSFGAMLRANYDCRLKFVVEEWQLLNFELIENSIDKNVVPVTNMR